MQLNYSRFKINIHLEYLFDFGQFDINLRNVGTVSPTGKFWMFQMGTSARHSVNNIIYMYIIRFIFKTEISVNNPVELRGPYRQVIRGSSFFSLMSFKNRYSIGNNV